MVQAPGKYPKAEQHFCFDQRKSIPDLAVEVVITGERETKLNRYAALHVPEVWFWIDNEIRVYCFDDKTNKYSRSPRSSWFPQLDLQRLALAATQEFRSAVKHRYCS